MENDQKSYIVVGLGSAIITGIFTLIATSMVRDQSETHENSAKTIAGLNQSIESLSSQLKLCQSQKSVEVIEGLNQSIENLSSQLQLCQSQKIDQLPARPSSLEVIGIQHKNTSNGKYFSFKASDLDLILGRTTWNAETLMVSRSRDGSYQPVNVWRSSNKSIGTGHGRLKYHPGSGDWRIGDVLFVRELQAE